MDQRLPVDISLERSRVTVWISFQFYRFARSSPFLGWKLISTIHHNDNAIRLTSSKMSWVREARLDSPDAYSSCNTFWNASPALTGFWSSPKPFWPNFSFENAAAYGFNLSITCLFFSGFFFRTPVRFVVL